MHKRKPSKSSKFRSIKIDRVLQQEHEHRKREVQLLLVGPPQSGKNTVCKQLRIQFGDGFPTATRMSLVPIILANLADAVTLVLENMNNLQIGFEDGSAKELAVSLLDARPSGGSFTEVIQRKKCASESSNDEGSNVYSSTNGADEVLLARPNSAIYQLSNQNGSSSEHKELTNLFVETADLRRSFTLPDSLDESNDEFSNLQDAILRALHEHDSIPPSLMKRLELMTDQTMMEQLQTVRNNPVQFQTLLLRCIGSGINQNHATMSREYRPPSPLSSPPKTFEDELLECLMGQNGYGSEDDSSSASSLTSRSGSGPHDTTGNHRLSCSVDEPSGEPTLDNRLEQNIAEARTDVVDSAQSNSVLDSKTALHLRRTSSLQLNPGLSTFIDFLDGSSRNPICLQSLKIVLKLLTEQPEFQTTITERELREPLIHYADSYFISHVDRIIQEDYVPTLQDLLVMREPSKAIRETLTLVGITSVRTIDMAEQSGYANRHLHYFESVNTVLFLVSLIECIDSKHNTIREHKLSEYITLFKSLITSPHMVRKDFVVFLNKLDLVRHAGNPVAQIRKCSDANTAKIDTLVHQIQQAFLFERQQENAPIGRLSFQVTCALDVDQMKDTIHECVRGIFEPSRKRHTFL